VTATSGHLLIIGAGHAGVQLATSVREFGWHGPVTLVGAEPIPPYERPALSKAFLQGTVGIGDLALRSAAFYSEQGIGLVLGERIDDLEFSGDGGGRATGASGLRWAFDRLVLATGAGPRPLLLPGTDLDGVLMLRDIGDAGALAARLASARRLVVIGGGLVGLEVAAAAVVVGLQVTVVEAAPVLLGRVVSPVTAAMIEAAHRGAGMHVVTGVRPRRLIGGSTRPAAVSAVELEDGTRLAADLVLVAVGASPRDQLAGAAGLRCDNGVVVDAFSLASDGSTVALGDCANLPDPSPEFAASPGSLHAPRLRLESVDNATEQARAAAATLVGRYRPYRSVPWFWSDQGSLKLQVAGLARPDDSMVTRHGTRPGQHSIFRYRGDRLVAVECLNNPVDFLTVRKALADGLTLTRDQVLDNSVPLRSYLAATAPKTRPW
jgi:3-phenylpropionate/trans-cinnamate dioxygenase ferredoxin reductase subunit